MPVIAVTRQSPEQVMGWLKKKGEAQRVTFVPSNGFLNPAKKYRKYIFIVGSRDYSRNAIAIRDLPEHIVFVFGHSEVLNRYGLDVDLKLDQLVPQKGKLSPVGAYLDDLKKRAVDGSLFYSLMTFIYKLPSKTHQKPITNTICRWVYGGGRKSIEREIDALPIKMTAVQKHTLMKILAKPVTDRLCQAFLDIHSGACETDGEAVVKHNVQVFEIGYIRGNVEKTANITDTYVANQGV
ncbi:hypothetical protein pEaSNUABM14_00203 [Erwinia phage pEa_SNUABM_14]|uniref:Uncharacterized protein n=1 Tax=Erwinia phage pEa_SNUABM_7 TaxID=2866695 RepID=A0AAE8BLH9_9CAUD|nr:hypothetical protein MPK74_gp204 [Erwinia phage pEa_SNUABM_7]QYW03163.1 hypothetical protein pEaSNUABM13_00204 [Erwinia phage pEa_SNUABM_13]QYW03846.1 hypothetical protein pEaSNUABM45_00203 [Erwinia phage pEa_SNUABM_45]QYW04187.1 hypothetical protein pEaSNUABM46_00203 [Erwinia phage pEa_SNUABM_46]QYW04528.1 hypothetical protein pEaSNUABM14_00203 [Erwinia phage pEa_SNUABM_14]QYW05217.1 hypothetical protein pEaSNUABM21_00203 [Erwinia phage pEa_SNUABM_21]QYW05559.1 hypothetical protein pEaSNU